MGHRLPRSVLTGSRLSRDVWSFGCSLMSWHAHNPGPVTGGDFDLGWERATAAASS